jgi:2-polyprenyl-6-methoxyphenol hydroxylase-like FAD-dependent oxidoreductase
MGSSNFRGVDGRETVVETAWLISCDGAHSRVRHLNHIHFPGEEDTRQYLIADALMQTALAHDEVYNFLSDEGCCFFSAPKPRLVDCGRRASQCDQGVRTRSTSDRPRFPRQQPTSGIVNAGTALKPANARCPATRRSKRI